MCELEGKLRLLVVERCRLKGLQVDNDNIEPVRPVHPFGGSTGCVGIIHVGRKTARMWHDYGTCSRSMRWSIDWVEPCSEGSW